MLFMGTTHFVYAQNKVDATDIVGVWELQGTKTITNEGKQLAFIHFIKIINRDSSFVNLNLNPQTSVISHKGRYKLVADNYTETVEANSLSYVKIDMSGEQKLKLGLSTDKKFLTLTGTVKDKTGNQQQLREVYKKLEIKGLGL